jgi:hypothetical protein
MVLYNINLSFKGKFCIIAPENACSGGFSDWGQFEDVWQYGSNLYEPNADPVWEQDGVAPQIRAKGLNDEEGKRGRAFIPSDWPHKNFIDSHRIKYYGWIFDLPIINPNTNGYIRER